MTDTVRILEQYKQRKAAFFAAQEQGTDVKKITQKEILFGNGSAAKRTDLFSVSSHDMLDRQSLETAGLVFEGFNLN